MHSAPSATTRRSINGTVGLRVPRDVIKAKSAPYLKLGKPERLNRMVNEDDHTIVRTYSAHYRGLVEYYLPAGDVHRPNRLEGDEDLHAQNAGLQARLDGDQDGGPLQDHHRHPVRAAPMFQGPRVKYTAHFYTSA
jgi:hypothetical protein